jgi:hypothetical protein
VCIELDFAHQLIALSLYLVLSLNTHGQCVTKSNTLLCGIVDSVYCSDRGKRLQSVSVWQYVE